MFNGITTNSKTDLNNLIYKMVKGEDMVAKGDLVSPNWGRHKDN